MANISVSGVFAAKLHCSVASPVCCCVWMRTLLLVTFALDELAVSQATEHQNAPTRRLNL